MGVSGEPIWDEAAEQAVLGSVLLSEAALAQVAGVLATDDFYRPAHGVIWGVAVELWRSGLPVDLVTFAAELDRRGQLMMCGGGPYLHTLIRDVPTATNVTFYAAVVTEKAVLRRVEQAGLRITHLAESGAAGADLAEIVQFVRKEVEDATAVRSQSSALVPASTAAWALIDGLDQPPVGVVRSPWPALDDLLNGGFRPGEVTVVAANTSTGKSLVGGAIARSAGQDQHRTVMFTLEMSREQVMARMIADMGTVPLSDLIGHTVGPEDHVRAMVAAERVSEYPLWIDETEGLSVAQVRARAQQLGGVGLVVVDQLALLKPQDRRANQEQQLNAMSWELKETAKALRCPVIVLHQLNREPLKRIGGRPTKGDMRGSDAVAQNADSVILLWRPPDRPGQLLMILDKNRNGPVGEVTLRFEGKYARITTDWPGY